MCCCARERTAGPLIHIYTRSSLCLYPVCVLCVRVIYTHIIHPIPAASAIETRLSLALSVCISVFVSLPVSLSHSLSLSPSPIICVRKSSSGAAEKSKRNVANTGLTTITINTVLYTRGPCAVNNVYSNRL